MSDTRLGILTRREVSTRSRRSGDLMTRLSVAILLSFALLAALGPLLPLGSTEAVGVGPRLSPPSGDFIAGTDALGRSLLPRLVQGLRTTFLLAGASVLVTSVVSVLLGMIAAYFRGWVGESITRVADVLFTFPPLLLAILIAAITGPGQLGAVVSISLICAPMMIRVVRAAALGVVGRDFIVAARVGGARAPRILMVHVLPSIGGSIMVQATYSLSVGMLIESGLSFLGLGVQVPQASLGSLVQQGAAYLSTSPWLVLLPGLILALVIMSVNLLGDGLRDRLDVRGMEVRR
jgi:peptide/nickel transport system permease protein